MKYPALLAGCALAALAAPAHAQERARTTVQPYIEVSQTFDADLENGDVLTYTSAAAGVDVSVDTARASAQLSYRYEHRFSWDDDYGDDSIHSGLARATVRVTPGVSLEGGALATRTRYDIRGEAPGVFGTEDSNVSQVYSLYAGPTLSKQLGPVAVSGLYRIGYTKVETPGFSPIVAGQPRLDLYDSSLGQIAGLTASLAPGTELPVGLTSSAGWERETSGALRQRYESWFVRDDVLFPVSPNLALTAGLGYEEVKTSERAPQLTATGAPVLDANGRFVLDETSARRVTYRTDGVYYDAGVVWRPSRRTSVEAHIGRRYGSTSFTGVASWAPRPDVGVQVGVYDTVTTFGRQLRQGIANLPTSFISTRDQFAQAFNGCTFGTSSSAPGGCLDGVFQAVTTASYRARGLDAVVSATRGATSFGVGAGYANRKLFAPNRPGITIYGLEDDSYYAQAFFSRALSPVSSFDVQAFADYYEPGLAGSEDVFSAGATASYGHQFGRLSTNASLGIYHFRVGDGIDTSWRAQALLGARYSFGGTTR
ncbi:hypothetical protein [Sphingomonas sp.]|jgi:hypothetical protein|uniref:hypothetical protein n=1 Tax=Sphingomonas sp. TaxID=28214 RepID=UPI002D7EB774|nr:hypothetical protein [Sphingomonas sp.]HEU0043591.1 hypothetical protein [Sphingomonas sp.]